MNAREIALIRMTWNQVAAQSDVAGRLFFTKLLGSDPSLRTMIRGDLTGLSKSLLTAAARAVEWSDRFAALSPALRVLGARYAGCGIEESHYTAAGRAWMWMLRVLLADTFTEEAADAWRTYLEMIGEAMKGGASRACLAVA